MPIVLKRLIVSLFEAAAEAVLLSLFMHLWWGYSDPVKRGFLFRLFMWAWAILTVFMVGSGYLITTAILRMVWVTQRLWTFSTAAAALVLLHLQIFSFLLGKRGPEELEPPLQVASACIVFACTMVGGWILRRLPAFVDSDDRPI